MLHSVIYVTGNRHWLHRARATVELLRQETPEIIAPNLWFRIKKKQPISQSCRLIDLGCYAASCLPETNP